MTTRCSCIKITRRDATVEGWTEHDDNLTIGGVTYYKSAGYTPFAIGRTSDLSADDQDIVGVIDDDNLSAGDLRSGVYDGARLDVLLVDWSTQTLVATLGRFIMGAVTLRGDEYQCQIRSLESEFDKPIGRTVQINCPHRFGDTACGYAVSADAGTVDSVTTSRRVFVDASLAQADGYYDGGELTWVTGANAGRTMDVKTYTAATDTVELWEPMPDDIAAADTYTIKRGCDKTWSTCVSTYANGANFGGFPNVPGETNILAGNT